MIDDKSEIGYNNSVGLFSGKVGWSGNWCYGKGTGKDSVLLSVFIHHICGV